MKRKIFFVIIVFGLFLSLFVANSFASDIPSQKILPSEGPTYQVNTIPFDWIDITSTGTHISLGDDSYQDVLLPFSFPFYDSSFGSVLVSSNGFLSLDITNYPMDLSGNIPQSYPYVIALFWTDLFPDDSQGGGGVYYQSFGDYFVIQYDNISTYSGELAGNFEAVLHSSGLIQMYYDVMNNTFYTGTIGVDRGDYADYTSYYLGYLAEEVGIEFTGEPIIEPTGQYFVKNIPFDWIDITSTGTHLSTLGDDSYETVPLPFSFPFYDNSFDSVLVSSNGFLCFDTEFPPYDTSGSIPQSYYPYIIALFWRDLYPDDSYGSGGVYYQSFGDYIVIQYDNISTYSGELAGDFEVILHSSGTIQMYYNNMEYIDGTIGVDRGDHEYYTTYELLTTEAAGIEFSRGAGVVISSSPFYTKDDTEYTLTWSPTGTTDVSYYEVFVNGELYVTTEELSATISVSSPDSYDIEVVLYTTDLDIYQDNIYLDAIEPIIKGLYEGAYLVYRFNYLDSEIESSHMIYKAELVSETSPYLWLVNITMSIFEYEDSVEPMETSHMSQELDAAFLSTPGLFWSNAHQLSLGDEMIGVTGNAIIIGNQTLEFPELEMSFDCWVTEVPMYDEIELTSVYYCNYTGVLIAIESSIFIEGRLIDFDYPFKSTNEEPYVDIREPDRREKIDSDTIDVEVRAYDDKPGLIVEVKLDDGDWEEMDYVEDDDWEYTFTDVDDGEHTIYARAIDSDGAEDTDSVTFTVGQEEGSKPPPSITPGFEFTLPIFCLLSLFVYYKRRKS